MNFWKSNDIGSPVVSRSYEELAVEFLETSTGRLWAAGEIEYRLARLIQGFLVETYGGWDPHDPNSDIDGIVEEVLSHGR